jgi:hypothetical protein
LEAPHVLKARRARRSAQEGSKGSDGADVTLLCPRREVATPILGQDPLIGSCTVLSTRTPARSALPRERFSPLAQSGNARRRRLRPEFEGKLTRCGPWRSSPCTRDCGRFLSAACSITGCPSIRQNRSFNMPPRGASLARAWLGGIKRCRREPSRCAVRGYLMSALTSALAQAGLSFSWQDLWSISQPTVGGACKIAPSFERRRAHRRNPTPTSTFLTAIRPGQAPSSARRFPLPSSH